MSDTEQEWKPNPRRPQSTMAQAFSLALDSAFMLDSDVDHLTQSIEQKKQMMTIQARELEALQAKIREAEERLKRDGGKVSSSHNDGQNGGSVEDQEGRGENELAGPQSPTSSALSDGHSSDQGSTDSGASAATSHDLNVGEDLGKGETQTS